MTGFASYLTTDEYRLQRHRTLSAKKTERDIKATALDIYSDLRFQKLLELIREYATQCMSQAMTEKVTDLRQLGVMQGRVQALNWLADNREALVKKVQSLDHEIDALQNELSEAESPAVGRMTDTTRRGVPK